MKSLNIMTALGLLLVLYLAWFKCISAVETMFATLLFISVWKIRANEIKGGYLKHNGKD